MTQLRGWSSSSGRKPLILKGARQVGKTTLVKAFGKTYYGDIAYFNFEKQPEIHDFFSKTKDPQRIISSLNLLRDRPIESTSTLIFFDEIQECSHALTALKYFQEEMPEYAVIAAGSLLGVATSGSFPVGKVDFMQLYPMSYEEFLMAADPKLHRAYKTYLDDKSIQPIPEAFYNPMMERFKEYMICGGMPEVVRTYLNTKSIEETTKIQNQLLESYQRDFVKHVDSNSEAQKITYIWDSLPSQLSRDNKKFIYGAAKKGAKARAYEDAIEWLRNAGLVLKAHRVKVPRLPLSSYRDLSAFKLYLLDVGLLFGMSRLNPKDYIDGSTLLTEFKGALTENFIAQALTSQGIDINYWTSEGKAEVDFIVDRAGQVIPLEIKAGRSTKAKSLQVYKEKYEPQLSVKITANNLAFDGEHLLLPLFYAGQLTTMVDKAMQIQA